MLEAYGIGGMQEYAEFAFDHGLRGGESGCVFHPLVGVDGNVGLGHYLSFAHRGGVDEFDAYFAVAIGVGFGPYAEAVGMVFFKRHTEEAFVGQASASLAMAGVAEGYVVRIALKRAVGVDFDVAECFPSHERIGEFERAVFDFFGIETAVGSVVDVFEKESVHCGLYGCSGAGVDVELGLCGGRDGRCGDDCYCREG